MLVIGLTGGIASGKSFVAECFAETGCPIIDADSIGHEVLMLPEIVGQIRENFGDKVIVDGNVDRSALAAIVFANQSDGPSEELKLLESITHPEIGRWMSRRLTEIEQSNSAQAVIMDAPVMFKAKWDRFCDHIVFVHASLETRQQRAALRGWPVGELERRERQQLPLDQKRERSTDVVDNSGSADGTRQQVRNLMRKWLHSD